MGVHHDKDAFLYSAHELETFFAIATPGIRLNDPSRVKECLHSVGKIKPALG